MKITAKKALIIGLASTTLFGLSGCNVEQNEEPAVYGPPSDLEEMSEDMENFSDINIINVDEDSNINAE